MSEVVVYEMSHTGGFITPTSGMEELETEITVPGYVDMEVFLFQETQSANPQILLLVHVQRPPPRLLSRHPPGQCPGLSIPRYFISVIGLHFSSWPTSL